jgi:hypothetical protein
MTIGRQNAKALLGAIAGFAATPKSPQPAPQDKPIKLGTIDPSYEGFGPARVTFDGETSMSTKYYVCVNCAPAPSARVILAPVGKTYVVIGTVGSTGTQNWEPVVPTSISSTGGAGATFDTVTGAITVPASCTLLKVNGVFVDGYEYMIRTREADSFTTFTDSMKLNLLSAGVALVSAAYEFAGRYSQFDGTSGIYSANAATYLPVGPGYTGGGGEVQREINVMQAHEAALYKIFRLWSYTTGAARETTGSGHYPPGTADGFQLATTTGSFAASSVRVYRRKALAT